MRKLSAEIKRLNQEILKNFAEILGILEIAEIINCGEIINGVSLTLER
ncbi:hypothetical protein [Gilliamella sp. M0320]|nr:hypothetical protein [Gilliamella sp. M0320]